MLGHRINYRVIHFFMMGVALTASADLRTTPSISSDQRPDFTQVNKVLFDIEAKNGVYTDVTEGDYIKGGQRYRDADGRRYRVFYYLNDVPYQKPDGCPLDFNKVKLPNGLLLSIRKLYAQADWVKTFDEVLRKQNEAWCENPGSDEFKMYKTAMQSITTAGGENLKVGLPRMQNPGWLDCSRLAPQYWKHPAVKAMDKAVCMHNIVSNGTPEAIVNYLRRSGVTHVWEIAGRDVGLDFDRIGVCTLFSTGMFGSHEPSEELVRNVARNVQLYPNMQITDEFGEGTYAQWNGNTSQWFYDELNKKAKKEKKDVRFLGEYGSQSITPYQDWRREWNSPREPLNGYFLSLLESNIVDKLDDIEGATGQALKHYVLSGNNHYRGRCIANYYSLRSPDRLGDWVASFGWMAMLHYSAEPDQDVMLFSWPKMQSNMAMIDMAQRDSGTRRPDGTIAISFPHCLPELAKMNAFFGLLFYDSVYLWDDWGRNPDDDNKFNAPGISIDAFMVGVKWYADLIPTLKQARRDILVCDYVANGKPFRSMTKERRISRKGRVYYENQYFNEVAAAQRGLALCIPGRKKAFIYVNPYRSPLDIEKVTVQHGNARYDLGDVPGMTLIVAREH